MCHPTNFSWTDDPLSYPYLLDNCSDQGPITEVKTMVPDSLPLDTPISSTSDTTSIVSTRPSRSKTIPVKFQDYTG